MISRGPRHLLLIAAVVCLATSEKARATEWEYETIRGSVVQNGDPCLKTDAFGVPHVVYKMQTDPTEIDAPVYYAFRSGSGWDHRMVVSVASRTITMDLDQQGEPHLIYQTRDIFGNGELLHRYRSGGYWTGELVEAYSPSLPWISMKIQMDTGGTSHLITLNHGRSEGAEIVYHLKSPGGPWSTVMSFPSFSDATSIALASGTSPRIINHPTLTGSNTYLRPDPEIPGAWTSEVLPTSTDRFMDLAMHGAVPHIVYYEGSKLMHATRTPTWQETELDPTASNGNIVQMFPPSVAVDGNGDPHVAYHVDGNINRALRYARYGDGSWTVAVLDTSTSSYQGTGLAPSLDIDVFGNPHIAYYDELADAVRYVSKRDCDGDGVSDSDEFQAGTATDCNGNGIPDACDMATGFEPDCNDNGIPDSCEPDCNGNGIPDDCDINSGTSRDCNLNSIPDDCEDLPDCNDNGVPDLCDIYRDFTSEDCNRNDVPDECEYVDCNGNGIFDGCDIRDGASIDCDRNGIPDECDLLQEGVDCNENGTLDVCDFGTHLVLEGESSGDRFGSALAGGDVNGDGALDLVVGAWSYGPGGQAGRAYVFFGGAAADAVPDLVLTGDSGDRLGLAVAAGDVNDDGFDDVVVSAPGPGGFLSRAEVRVHLGGAELSPTPDHVLYGSYFSTLEFGHALALADVDNDGHDEVIVGVPSFAGGTGEVRVFRGVDLEAGVWQTWAQENDDDDFGVIVAAVGDVDGNGVADIAVGAPGYPGGLNRGRAYLFLGQTGSVMTGGPVFTETAGDYRLGAAIAGAGDVDGDGFDDLLIGADQFDGVNYRTGKVELHLGGPGIDVVPDLELTGTGQSDNLGAAVVGAGDVSGDGLSDLVLGAPGADFGRGVMRVHFGGSLAETAFARHLRGSSQYSLGDAVAAVGDWNGDGYNEFAVSAPGYDVQRGRITVLDILLPDFEDTDGDGYADVCLSPSAVESPDRAADLVILAGASPTPFNAVTTIHFALGRAADVRLRIYDLSGRLVATLVDEVRMAGPHEAVWRGTDAAGRQVSSGVFVCRLEAAGVVRSARLTLLK